MAFLDGHVETVNLVETPSDPSWPADAAAFMQTNHLGFPTTVRYAVCGGSVVDRFSRDPEEQRSVPGASLRVAAKRRPYNRKDSHSRRGDQRMAVQPDGTLPPRRSMLKSKIHRATVTHADVDYEGSLTLDALLLQAAEHPAV